MQAFKWPIMFILLLPYSCLVDASIIKPLQHEIVQSKSFSGNITDIIKEDWAYWIEEGDIGVGSELLAEIQLWDIGEGADLMLLVAEFTFYGMSRNYKFSVDAGPTTNWGEFYINSNNTLFMDFTNNFFSDGLEQTFHDQGGDFGNLWMELKDYNKATINGLGGLRWEGLTINFSAFPSNSIPEPLSLNLLIIGIVTVFYRRILGKS